MTCHLVRPQNDANRRKPKVKNFHLDVDKTGNRRMGETGETGNKPENPEKPDEIEQEQGEIWESGVIVIELCQNIALISMLAPSQPKTNRNQRIIKVTETLSQTILFLFSKKINFSYIFSTSSHLYLHFAPHTSTTLPLHSHPHSTSYPHSLWPSPNGFPSYTASALTALFFWRKTNPLCAFFSLTSTLPRLFLCPRLRWKFFTLEKNFSSRRENFSLPKQTNKEYIKNTFFRHRSLNSSLPHAPFFFLYLTVHRIFPIDHIKITQLTIFLLK